MHAFDLKYWYHPLTETAHGSHWRKYNHLIHIGYICYTVRFTSETSLRTSGVVSLPQLKPIEIQTNNSNSMESVEKTAPQQDQRKPYQFSSTFSSYLTLIGYALGMGDIWRFPFMAYRNGGGAFLIPYVVMVIVCGIPLYFLEYSIGKFAGRGPYRIWDISPLFRGVGITVSVGYGVYMVGSSIFRCWIGQCILYAFQDPIPWSHCDNDWNTPFCKSNRNLVSRNSNALVLVDLQNGSGNGANMTSSAWAGGPKTDLSVHHNVTGTEMSAAEEFWQYKVLQLSSGISDLSPVIWHYFLQMLILRTIICLSGIKSIKSIEKVIYVTAPVPFIMTVAIFIRSLMLPGAADGIKYFFYPSFETLLRARVWIEAALMAFYSLSFGWGGIILMASHADFKDNCLRTSIVLPAIDALAAIFSGLVCFSILGNMADSYDVDIREVVNAGMSTGIVAYITALSSLPIPQLWAGLFLISMYLTGVESQLIPLEMIMQFIGDLYPRMKPGTRLIAIFVVSLTLYVLSLPTCTGGGGYQFLWTDWYSGAWIGPIVAVVEVVVVAWIYGLDRLNEDVNMMIGRRIPAILRIALAVVSPAVITVIFFTSLVEYVPPRYGSYSYPTLARILGWLLVAIIMMPIVGQAVYSVRQAEGPFIKKIKYLTEPTESWGPNDEEKMAEYQEKKSKYNSRTFKDLFYFNMFGSYPSSSAMHRVSTQELEWLKK
ncbi:sodium-dependent proline transporter-like [Mercenaria mercenaria]|uniref:sodium-dependent proline transporter-like n=1 Tax=Mercenaria mercenaria TaxID=6596 RepID=UPI00234F56BE|nr:sodium-dependent proline transporter-like [Mercenaria mercenaria]